ncbi:MAG: DEAD/DEAH box helicase [Flavobacteriia bacterium]
MNFEQLNLIEPILKALSEEGYTSPTPIQEQTIPYLLAKKDVLGCAQTGTGKTAAFAIPILQILHNEKANYAGKRKIKALIVTPTRELAIQIGESFDSYGKYTGITNTVIFGGVSQHSQVNRINNGVDVLVATPGRLLDLIAQGIISLSHVELFVLDEADRMLDMGFIHYVKKLLTLLPKERQSLFFSATMPPVILTLAGTILKDPMKVEVAPVSSTADTIQQKIFFVEKGDKPKLLAHLLQNPEIETVLVFTKTKHGADRVCKTLMKSGIKAEAIHGNKAQNARQRALTNFKAKTIRVLVATDIAARGIDVDELQFVINFDIPNIPETYVHRIGRTGRAGHNGTSFSFCDQEEKAYLKDIQKLIDKVLPVEEDHPFAMDPSMPAQNNPNKPKKADQHRASNQQGFGKKPNPNKRKWSNNKPKAKA